MNLAEKLNNALSSGYTIMANVYNGSTQFNPKWAGKFSMDKNGDIIVKLGKKKVCFSIMGTEFKAYR